jgi:hypothetical protein
LLDGEVLVVWHRVEMGMTTLASCSYTSVVQGLGKSFGEQLKCKA